MNAPRHRAASLLALAAFCASLAAQGTPIGFEETYALAPDRAAAVATLIPGTDDWYYYHCRERLDARDFATVRQVLPAWIQRHGRSQRTIEIENRETLLSFGDDPERTWTFLRDRLGLRFDHQRVVPGERTELPTRLDPELLSHAVLTERALQQHPSDTDGFTARALPALAQTGLDGDRLRSLLTRLQRPDVDNLPALIVRDLDHRQSGGFGSLPIHGELRLAQLEECVRLRPRLLQDPRFVEAWLQRMEPTQDVDWRRDPIARAAELQRLWSFAQRLSPAFNSLKAHVLYHWLQHDLSSGAPDRDRFLTYVQLPRRSGLVAEQHLRRHQNAPEFVTPQQEFPTGLPPIGDDEALLRRCLQHFFAAEDGYESYAEFLPADWLQRLFAETKLLLGQGDPERWYSLLADPADVARLDQRVELEFAATSRTEYGGAEPVTLELDVKNVPVLLLKVFAIDAFRYHAEKQREVDASIELDGVVANHEQTFRYDDAPMRRVRRTFALPMLAEPGTYVVEFVGNGISSRAVIHKGHLRCAVRPAAGGHVFRIHDETGAPRRQASIWFGGRDYAPDAAGDILLPFTTDPGRHAVVLHEGKRSTLQGFDHLAETYALHGGVHVEREALVAGRTTRLLLRPQLRLGAHPVSVQLLQQPVLTLIATDLDGIATKQEVRDLQLLDGQELVHEFAVPERLVALQVQLSATVRDLAGKDMPLATTAVTFPVNGIDRGATTTTVQLLRTPQGHVLEARGKNGEVKAGFACRLQLAHRDYAEPIEVTLQTDSDGRIGLGALPDIDTVQVHGAGFAGSFALATRACRLPTVLHGLAGETLRLPYQGTAPQPTRAEFSLLGWERDEFARLALADGFVELRGLEPGDYELTLHETGTRIPVRITRGGRDGDWLIGRERALEAGSALPLQLHSLALDATGLTIRVANPTAATRVHVATTRFLPAFPLFDDLGGAPSRLPIALDAPPIESSYHAGRQLGDEYRYVLERRFATKYAGNMLPRPSLLLNPWQLDEQSWNSAVGLGGGAGGGYGGRGRRRAGGHPAAAPGSPPVDVGAAGEFANLDWLPRAAPLLANLRPDADGVVRVPAAELGDGQIVHVLAVDGDQAVHDTTLRAEVPLQPRPRQLREALDATRHFVEQKRIEFVAAGETAVLPDARAAQVEVYDSLATVHGLLATLCGDPALSRFAFVLQWPLLDDAQKRARYAENACHELHFFLYQKDRAFFDAVVRPLLADKLAKTFLDHWLLGHDLQRYVEPWAFAQLNLIERILLAQRLDEQGRAAIARSVRELLELRPVPPSTLDTLFDRALKAQQLGTEGDVQRQLMQDLSRGPGDTMPPQPTAAAPAPAERRAFDDRDEEAGKDKKADADEPAHKPEAEANESAEQTQGLLEELKQRGASKQLWRAVEATRLLLESDYWRRTPAQTTPDVVAPNRFWRDYATAPAGRPFASTAVVEAHGSFLEAMFALAVLDLPFAAGRHEVTADGDRRTLRAATPLLLVRKEVTATDAAADVPPLLVGQNLFRLDERYRFENGEPRDAFVTDEFLVDTGYGCQVVVTNPTSQRRTVALLLQIPAGALPLNSGFWTKSRTIELQPYATATVEYAFYFPAAGDFAHYAVQAAEAGALAAAAAARTLHVVVSPSRVDTGSWEHVSQLGSAAEVLAHIDGANVQRLDLGRIAWRLRDRGFFGELLPRLRTRHAFDATVWSYGILHRDEAAAREFLQYRDDFVAQCGAVLQSPLLTFDVVERKRYQHLELDPLVHARAHRLGSRRGIGNEHLATQHRAAMDRIGYHAQLDADDWITVAYLLLLQDRVEEALQAYAKIDAARVTTHLQYDYLTAYAAFFTGDLDRARRTAERHRDHPVAHWQRRFTEVLAQLDEAQGRPSPGRGDQVPTDLAAAAPSLELALEGRRATVAWRNLPQCEVRFYELDVEFAFSARPFASDDGTSAAYVQPILTRTLDLPADQRELTFDLPDRFAQKNVLVEVRGAGLVRSQTWFANALQVRFLESWGQVAVSEPGTGTPLPKAYVKVFAKLPSGQVRFHKDGYTDLRGRFDYASLSDDPNAGAVRYAVLVLDDQRGAVIRELAPPTR